MKWLALFAVVSFHLAALVAQFPAPPSEKRCPFRGQIRDPAAAPINRAFVLLYSSHTGKIDQQVNLDKSGEFQVKVAPGLYDIFAAYPGFQPVARIVDLRRCKPVDLKIEMRVDNKHLED